MSGRGIHHLYVETHSWDSSVEFWGALGYRPDTTYVSGPPDGILRPEAGDPYVFLREVPADQADLAFTVVFGTGDVDALASNAAVTVARPPFEAPWGPTFVHLTDPDG